MMKQVKDAEHLRAQKVLGEAISRWRCRNGYLAKILAKESGVSMQQWCKYERGENCMFAPRLLLFMSNHIDFVNEELDTIIQEILRLNKDNGKN